MKATLGYATLKSPVRTKGNRLNKSAASAALMPAESNVALPSRVNGTWRYVDFPEPRWKEPSWTAEYATPEGRERLLNLWATLGAPS